MSKICEIINHQIAQNILNHKKTNKNHIPTLKIGLSIEIQDIKLKYFFH